MCPWSEHHALVCIKSVGHVCHSPEWRLSASMPSCDCVFAGLQITDASSFAQFMPSASEQMPQHSAATPSIQPKLHLSYAAPTPSQLAQTHVHDRPTPAQPGSSTHSQMHRAQQPDHSGFTPTELQHSSRTPAQQLSLQPMSTNSGTARAQSGPHKLTPGHVQHEQQDHTPVLRTTDVFNAQVSTADRAMYPAGPQGQETSAKRLSTASRQGTLDFIRFANQASSSKRKADDADCGDMQQLTKRPCIPGGDDCSNTSARVAGHASCGSKAQHAQQQHTAASPAVDRAQVLDLTQEVGASVTDVAQQASQPALLTDSNRKKRRTFLLQSSTARNTVDLT